MASLIKFIPSLFNIGGKVVEGISKNAEMKKQIEQSGLELDKLEKEINFEVQKLIFQDKQSIRNLIIAYEGKYSELPRWLQILRSSYRPIISYLYTLLGLVIILLSIITGKNYEVSSYFWKGYLLVMAFYFGERLGSRIIEQIKK